METPEPFFMLFPSCVPVRGAKNSAIYDLTRHQLLLFPSAYFDVICALDRAVVDSVIAANNWEAERKKIEGVVDYLIDNEVAFFTGNPDSFPPLDTVPRNSSVISNAIVDVNESLHDFPGLMAELDELGCEYLQVRGFSATLGIEAIQKIATHVGNTSIRSIEIIAKDSPDADVDAWLSLLRDFKIISRLVVHSAKANHREVLTEKQDMREVEFIQEHIVSADACGRIRLGDVNAPSIPVYLETMHFNGCLNRKIAIASDGSIRNCPSMPFSYGKTGEQRLSLVTASSEFRRLWDIRKDQVEICKDCEFRYACTDCRAYVEGNDTYHGKPAKCSYNPYTGLWADSMPSVSSRDHFKVVETQTDYASGVVA